MINSNFESRIKATIKATQESSLPLVIELAGMPRVGKTEFMDAFVDLVRRSDCKAMAYVQGEYSCPITDSWSVDFSAWGITTFIKKFYEFKYSGQQIIIADRGLFDAIVWMKLKLQDGRCDHQTYTMLRQLALAYPWWNHQAVVVVFNGPIEDILNRAKERRLYEGESWVTNKDVLPRLQRVFLEETEVVNNERLENKKNQLVRYLNTDGKNLNAVLYQAAEIVLSSIEKHD